MEGMLVKTPTTPWLPYNFMAWIQCHEQSEVGLDGPCPHPEGQSRLNLGIFFLPNQSLKKFNSICFGRFSCGQFWSRTECSGIFHNGSFPVHSARNRNGFFPDIQCENLVEDLEVSKRKVWETPRTSALEFLILQFVHTEPSAVCQKQIRFLGPAPVLWKCLLVGFCRSTS